MNNPLYDWGNSFASKFNLKDYPHVLDLGCREGQITTSLAKQYPKQQFVAIDNSPAAIEKASSYLSPNVNFELQDALNLPYHNQFDAVISFNCLLWVKDKALALKQIYQALKPGAKAYLQLFVSHGRLKNDRFLFQMAHQTKWQSFFKEFSVDYHEISLSELYHYLINTGFIIHRLEFAKYQSLFKHRDELREWMSTWTCHQKMLPFAKHKLFMDDTVSAYMDYHHFEKEEPFPYEEYLLEVICEKPLQSFQTDDHKFTFGNITFNSKEAIVLKHLLLGCSAKEIAQKSGINTKTVEYYLSRVKEKLVLNRRSEIYQAAILHGFINLIYDNRLP